MHIDGGCHCGAISFIAEIDPSPVMACHCADCQILSGALFREVVTAPIRALAVSGTTKSYVKVAQSGNRRAQVFCPECGTPRGRQTQTSPRPPSFVLTALRNARSSSQPLESGSTQRYHGWWNLL